MVSEKVSKRTVYNSFFWKILERFSSQGINLIIQIILARIIIPVEFGNLAIIVAITNYAALFVQSGISTVIIQKKDIEKDDISTLLTFNLFISIIIYILIFTLSPLISSFYDSPNLVSPLRVLGIIVIFNAIHSVQTGLLIREMKFKTIFIRSIIAVPISGAISIVLAYYNFGIWALVVHNVLNTFLVVFIMFFDKNLFVKIKFSFSRFKTIYSFALKILGTSLISGMSDFVRTMVIGKYYTKESLAYYDKANTYSYYAVSIINTSISSVLLPTFSKSQDNLDDIKRIARNSFKLSIYLMVPLMLGIAAISKPLIYILLTNVWAESIPFLMIFCILRIPTFVMTTDKQVYYALGKGNINLVYEILLAIVNISSLFLTVKYGIIYIALGYMFIEYLSCIALCFVSKRVYTYSLRERMLDCYKSIISSLLMFTVVFSLNYLSIKMYLLIAIQITIGIIVYFGMSAIIKDDNFIYLLQTIKLLTRRNKND